MEKYQIGDIWIKRTTNQKLKRNRKERKIDGLYNWPIISTVRRRFVENAVLVKKNFFFSLVEKAEKTTTTTTSGKAKTTKLKRCRQFHSTKNKKLLFQDKIVSQLFFYSSFCLQNCSFCFFAFGGAAETINHHRLHS